MKLSLSPPDAHDLQKIWLARQEPRVSNFFFNKVSNNVDDHFRWYRQKTRQPGFRFYMVNDGPRTVGTFTLDHQGKGIEFGRSIVFRGHEGKGYGTEMLKKAIEAARTFDGATFMFIRTREDNIAMRRASEKAGFTLIGIADGVCHYELEL